MRFTMDQSDGIYNGLPGIFGNVNRLCPQATPSDSGRFTAKNLLPHAITITYVYCPIGRQLA